MGTWGHLQESVCEPGEGPAQMAHGLGSSCMYCSVCVCVCVCVCVYTNVPVMMRLQEVHGNDQDQPLIPWWDEGPVKGPERKGGGALGLLERLTVCGDADGGPGRGGASVGTGLLRLGERAGESPRWVNGHWGTSRGGPESQARRSPGPSPPLLLQSKTRRWSATSLGPRATPPPPSA